MDFDEGAILSITRPKDSLFTYYMLQAVSSLVAMPVVAILLYFRFHTMRYKFDEEGISMSWGILFHHEIVLNYSRIQDIHLRSNFIERLLGLARIEVQTASAGAGAEMTLEGMDHVEHVRDFLYSRMRGAKKHGPPTQTARGSGSEANMAAAVLSEVATELRRIREAIEEKKG